MQDTNSSAKLSADSSVDEVSLDIDYAIIEHFSSHLYGSPNKAIEELVTNGFDALARSVRVYLPGRFIDNHVVVWDNGESMNTARLKGLWHIANSPKVGERIATKPGVVTRKIIGKFGIGKLASYTVGDAIAHLCKSEDGFRLVEIDYRVVKDKLKVPDGDRTGRPASAFTTPIKSLTELEARQYAEKLFVTKPDSFDKFFDSDTWTLAVISHLKRKDLHPARLRYVLGNSMPIRPDFGIFVEEEPVVARLDRTGNFKRWNFGDDGFKQDLLQKWNESKSKGDVSGDISFDNKVGIDPKNPQANVAFVTLPNLGQVWGDIRLYEDSLYHTGDDAEGRSHGFFIMVRSRLINPMDDKMFLNEPSFGTFYRSQFVLNIDALDADLLADRERLRRDTSKADELTVLQRAVYQLVRTQFNADVQEKAKNASPSSRLPVFSREQFIEPLMALLARKAATSNQMSFDFRTPQVTPQSAGIDEPMAALSQDGKGFTVNTAHPFVKALEQRAGTGGRGAEIMREIHTLAIYEELFKGFLYEINLPDEKVDAIVTWRDSMYRNLAEVSRSDAEQLMVELKESSYQGDKVFEGAIVSVLKAMGFVAERDGASGKKDIALLAPCGEKSYKFTFEAKGKKDDAGLPNDDAEISNANAHRNAVNAEHSVVVTRRFAGFDRPRANEVPTILQECRVQHSDDGRQGVVSIMQVDALNYLLKVMTDYHYPLDLVKEVFTTIETPVEKMARIKQFDEPLHGFDFLELLNRIWEEQKELGVGEVVSCLSIWQKYYRSTLPDYKELFQSKINALYILASPYVILEPTTWNVGLRQSPERVATRIRESFAPVGVIAITGTGT